MMEPKESPHIPKSPKGPMLEPKGTAPTPSLSPLLPQPPW